MTTILIMLILGIALSISKANEWFIVPDFCIWITFGIAGILFLVWLINLISAKKTIKKINRRF